MRAGDRDRSRRHAGARRRAARQREALVEPAPGVLASQPQQVAAASGAAVAWRGDGAAAPAATLPAAARAARGRPRPGARRLAPRGLVPVVPPPAPPRLGAVFTSFVEV